MKNNNPGPHPAGVIVQPKTLSYQGLLTTASGAPATDGSYNLQFDLYDSLTGGSSHWTETHNGVSVQRGTFSVLLGTMQPLNVDFNNPLFVQIIAPGGPVGPSYPLTFSPRSPLSSAPSSLAPWANSGQNIYFNDGLVGIGTRTPGSNGIPYMRMELDDSLGLQSDVALRVAGGSYADLDFASSGGTLTAPTSVLNGQALGNILFLGHNGAGYAVAAEITAFVDSIAGTHVPTRLSFLTSNASGGYQENLRLDRNGTLGIDFSGVNNGSLHPGGLTFGAYASGEGIASKRTNGGNSEGLDFYTRNTPRMSITNGGNVGIGTTSPVYPLHVVAPSNICAFFDDTSSGNAFGMLSYAVGNAGPAHYGVFGNAQNAATNYGLFGTAAGMGSTNYAVYAAGNLAYTGTLTNPSDAKFKENIASYGGALERIMQLHSRTFTFKSGEEFDRFNFSPGKHYGFVAQELEEVFPELVVNAVHPASVDARGEQTAPPVEYKGVNSVEMIPILVQAMQEQQKLIEELQTTIAKLKKQLIIDRQGE
jgi:hypothetical protein